MTDVRLVLHGHAADVEAHLAGMQRFEIAFLRASVS